MKHLMTLSLAIATAISVNFTSKPALANCNSLSYWQTSDGRCFDLTALTELGSLQKEISKPPVFSNENIAITNLRLVASSISSNVRGTVTNTSKNSITVGMVDYELVNASGVPIADGTFIVQKTLSPGQTIAISNLISSSNLQGNKPSSLSVRAINVTP